MNKLVIAAFTLAVAGVVWLIVPPSETDETAQKNQSAQSAGMSPQSSATDMVQASARSADFPSEAIELLRGSQGEEVAQPPQENAEADGPQDDEFGSAPGYFDRVGSTAEPGTQNRVPAGSRRRPWPMATDGDFSVKRTRKDSDQPKPNALPDNDPFPRVHVALLKDSVSRYRQQFSDDEAMPAEARIADVVPAGIITELGVSPETQLTMLGPFHLDDVRAYNNVSAVSDEHHGLLGISYVTPDGESHRKYVRVQANIIDE